MKKIVGFVLIYFITSFLFIASPNTGINGSLLHTGWLQWKNAMEGRGQPLADSGAYIGFVSGIAQMALEYREFVIPADVEGVYAKQLFFVVGKFLEDHPELHHKDGLYLVRRALKEAFPPQ